VGWAGLWRCGSPIKGIPVAVVGRSEEALRQVTAEVQARGARAVPLHADLSDTAALSGLVDAAASQLGGIGVLVNAAGTDVPGALRNLIWMSGIAWSL
jgi:short-subunit dehydrogenase